MKNIIMKMKKRTFSFPSFSSFPSFLSSALGICLLSSVLASHPAMSMGEPATIFEASRTGGIWDHGNEFYLVHKLEISGQEEQIWGGFQSDSHTGEEPELGKKFQGEIKIHQFSPLEKTYKAQAVLVHKNESGKIFVVEVFEKDHQKIKEFFVKKENSALPFPRVR